MDASDHFALSGLKLGDNNLEAKATIAVYANVCCCFILSTAVPESYQAER